MSFNLDNSPKSHFNTEDVWSAQQALRVDFKSPPENLTKTLQGKTLLVTGGASGFGEAVVTAFARNPDTSTVIADINSKRGESLEQILREAGCNIKFIQVDVTAWESVVSLFRNALIWLEEVHGQPRTIDHVVTCAGILGEDLDISPVSMDDFLDQKTHHEPPSSRSINIGLFGSLYTVTAAMKFAMGLHELESSKNQGDRSITLFASMAGYSGVPLQADYMASKWGVRGLFKSLLDNSRVVSSPVRVNLVAPYFVRTPLTEAFVPYMQKIGVKMGSIDDVEAAVMRFMSDSTIYGRAAGVWDGGVVDLCDDLSGGFGSAALANGLESGALLMSATNITNKRPMR